MAVLVRQGLVDSSAVSHVRWPCFDGHVLNGHTMLIYNGTADFWPCLQRELDYDNIFRVLIVQFLDAYSFDVRSVKKSCIHIVHPDGRLIPFDTFNPFYRDQLETERLTPLRRNREQTTYAG
jgi:hypothetical protein